MRLYSVMKTYYATPRYGVRHMSIRASSLVRDLVDLVEVDLFWRFSSAVVLR